MNKSEELVTQLCTKSFLSLWSYPNPRGKDPRKELCDILVVCEPDVIILSVKDVGVTDSGEISVDWKRWLRRAIDDSVKQIYGAKRWIAGAKNIVAQDRKIALPIPDVSCRKIHRVAVALGGKEEVPLYSGDFGKGFVHVFDETSLNVVMGELDTITDFVKYLSDVETLFHKGVKMTIAGGEQDLLALYLTNGRLFPENWDCVYLDEDLWTDFSQRPEYQAKKKTNKNSYVWDRLIEVISDDFYAGNLEVGNSLSDVEQSLRTMARENRFSRRVLSKRFLEFIDPPQQKRVRSRFFQSPAGVPYVFLARPHGYDRNYRRAELANRCFVVRGLHPDQTTVVGIATEEYDREKGSSFDVIIFSKDNWTPEDQVRMESLQREMGYFRKPLKTRMHEDEYPGSASSSQKKNT